MGLLDSEPVADKTVRPCKFGRVLAGEIPNVDGLTLEPDDIDVLERDRLAGASDMTITGKLQAAGFDISKSTISDHFRGMCRCAPDSPLHGLRRA